MKYIHIFKTDGTHEKRGAPTKPTLEEMQQIVGGYIEPLHVSYEGHSRLMIVNEDGIQLDLPFNAKASAIARRPIVGNVLILEDYRLWQ